METLVPGLAYAKEPTASYISAKTSHTFFTVGGNTCSPTGVRVLRFEMQTNGDDFLVPASLRLAFKLINQDAAKSLSLLSNNPLCVFQRLRVLCRGTLVEDINYLHRTVDMFNILLPEQRRRANSLQMLGDVIGADNLMMLKSESIAPSKDRKVLVALPSGHLSATQQLFIPLKMCPIIIELEITPLVEQYIDTRDVAGISGSTTWSL